MPRLRVGDVGEALRGEAQVARESGAERSEAKPRPPRQAETLADAEPKPTISNASAVAIVNDNRIEILRKTLSNSIMEVDKKMAIDNASIDTVMGIFQNGLDVALTPPISYGIILGVTLMAIGVVGSWFRFKKRK